MYVCVCVCVCKGFCVDEWEDACVCDACLCKSFHITRKILFSLTLIITHSCHFNSLHFPSFLNHFSSLPLLRFPHIFFQAVAHRMQKINNINLGVVSLSLSLPLVLSLVCNFMNGSPRHNNKSEREIAREREGAGDALVGQLPDSCFAFQIRIRDRKRQEISDYGPLYTIKNNQPNETT